MPVAILKPTLKSALETFKKLVSEHTEHGGREGKPLVVFCEDRLSMVAERAICEATGGTFAVSVYTLSRFLSAERGKNDKVLTSQGSAMATRRLIEANRQNLQLFKRLSAVGAAQDVYDTLALLFASGVTADRLAQLKTDSPLLARKLHDLALLYGEYEKYLAESGAIDRNKYLQGLPEVIKHSRRLIGADVAFFGFQAFTASVEECVKACLDVACGGACEVTGIFIGGPQSKYVNESYTSFLGIIKERGLPLTVESDTAPVFEKGEGNYCDVSETLRRYLFEPALIKNVKKSDISGGQLCLAAAKDEREECEFIASQIVKCVKSSDVRYRDISIMLPDVEAYRPVLERALYEYGVPFYTDGRYRLSSHPVCEFLLAFLTCAVDGCRRESVIAAVGSPLFVFECEGDMRAAKAMFINYLLRATGVRGGAYKSVNVELCGREPGFDAETIERARLAFKAGVDLFKGTDRADGAKVGDALKSLLELYGAEKRLKEMAENLSGGNGEDVSRRAPAAVMAERAYNAAVQVIGEACALTKDDRLPLKQFIKILKSGFNATELSLIQPRQDAVFISDVSTCANAGSRILFAAALTDAVPVCTQDTAILTDGELGALDKLNMSVSPKISQVNRRVRETTALNVCAFSEKLYLTYPARQGGEEVGVSEIISDVKRLFTVGGNKLKETPVSYLLARQDDFIAANCRPRPAMRHVAAYLSGEKKAGKDGYATKRAAAVYKMLKRLDADGGTDAGLPVADGKATADWEALYGNSISPTALEEYFACPFMAFMEKGLGLTERKKSNFESLDVGDFIHAVLKEVGKRSSSILTEEGCENVARAKAEELIKYTALSGGDAGAGYTAAALIDEAVKIAKGMYAQIANSGFKVENTETRCSVPLYDDVKVEGKFDRVDSCGDMVRAIDYKTGKIDDKPGSYYMGLKLQLPIYLSAVSNNRRAVGAYYFPAKTDYTEGGVGDYVLKGFTDASEDVLKASDDGAEESGNSRYLGISLEGGGDKAMTREDFGDFLKYSLKIAEVGARAVRSGDVRALPVKGECEWCKYRGCCGYDTEKQGARESVTVKCKTIANIVREDGGEV